MRLYDPAMARVFSGIQPTGTKHLGNLLGALVHWARRQDEDDCIYCIVDLHSITIPIDPVELHDSSVRLAATLFAVGIDVERSILFLQSHVREHSELAWILSCTATYGELGRMTQFKEKSEGRDSVSVGIFTYPVLQAADILLYDTDRVPVGEDQRQHIELTRDIAQRFNGRYGDTFVLPEASIPKVGARIMDLQEPTRKMSTSIGGPGTIWFDDDAATVRKKIMRAVTDTGSEVRHDVAGKPGVSALLDVMAAVSGEPIAALEERYAGQGYGGFKKDVAEATVAFLEPIQARYRELMADPAELERLLARGADRARESAVPVMERVRDAVGFVR